MSVSESLPKQFEVSPLSRTLLLTAVLLGGGLRLIAAVWGDIGVYVDGALRIALAMKWAEHPTWMGLSGVWPPSHVYVLGALIRLWDQPVVLAKLIGFVGGVGTIFVFRSAVGHRFGPTIGSLCALLLAVYWTHIWLSSSYWVEVPYLLFVLLAVNYAEKIRNSSKWEDALRAGLFLSLAMLLRNEALLLLVLFALWFLLQIRNLKLSAAFVIFPTAVMAWYFIEPALHGGSYLDYFNYVARSKQFEIVEGISRKDAVYQWILMLSATPTLLVVLPGLYGLWENRRRAITDLFAWMFVAQVVFYISLTLSSAWRPQLRYLMLQFVNLFPYAALVWMKIMRRFSPRYVLPILVASMIVIQSVTWWMGRNNRLPGGWLPLQVITSSQKELDEFIGKIRNNQQALVIAAVVPGPRAERWTLVHSFVVNRMRSDEVDFREVDVHVEPAVLSGTMPSHLFNADVILIDPEAVFYSVVVNSISRQKPNLVIKRIHPRIEALVLSDRVPTQAISGVGSNPIK